MINRIYKFINKGLDNECWNFNGRTDKYGYGIIQIETGIFKLAHKVIYELEVGCIPDDAAIIHTCDNPSCCNPKHLTLTNKHTV